MLRKSLLIAAVLLTALPAEAQRGNNWRNNGNHHGNNDQRHYNNRNYRHSNDNWSFSFSFGAPVYSYYRPYSYSRNYSPGYVYGGLRPYECRWDREFGYWRGRPADLEVRRCADAYGAVYIVQGSQRLMRYRY